MNENAKNAQTVPPRRPAELESVPVPIVTRISPETTRISDAEADAWLGDLLAHIGRDDDALTRLAKAPSARVVPVFRTVARKNSACTASSKQSNASRMGSCASSALPTA